MTDTTLHVLAIGNAIVDVISRVDDAFLTAQGLTRGSMRLIDEAEAFALYDRIGPAIEVSGGSAANTVAGIASFGGKAGFIGRVRNDQLGQVFAHDLRAIGVHFDSAPAIEGPSTARCLILVTPDGERTMNTYLGVSSLLGAQDVPETAVAKASIVYLEGYLFDRPDAKAAFQKAAATARRLGRTVALSLSDAFCVDRHRDDFLKLIRNDVDVLFANEAEIKSLYQVSTFDDALQKVRIDCRIGALTRSGAGSVIVSGEEVHVVEAVKVSRVVDTTGAGDLYAAGFLFGQATGRSLVESARLGSLAASEIITHVGARPEKNLASLARESALL
jgi:sugar/nucleoside kinase (ribokinase family)